MPPHPDSQDSLDSLALFRRSSGEWLAVAGPFTDSAAPSPALPSFFVNDFSLSHPRPWKIGTRALSLDELSARLRQNPSLAPQIRWTEPDFADFQRVFAEIQQEIAAGELEKAVPACVQRGELSENPGRAVLAALLDAPPGLHPYGFVHGPRGFAGLSPEILLTTHGHELHTVALAGTAPATHAAALAQDRKEIREHELVAGYLYDKLATLGRVSRQPRALRVLGEMVHLESRLELQLEQRWRPEALIAKLHPTPALGTQPRTSQALARLHHWRQQLGVPPEFGAPFGVFWQDQLEIVVAIRGIWWDQKHLRLPTGCGIIRESQADKEWQELALKRQWVRQNLRLPHPANA